MLFAVDHQNINRLFDFKQTLLEIRRCLALTRDSKLINLRRWFFIRCFVVFFPNLLTFESNHHELNKSHIIFAIIEKHQNLQHTIRSLITSFVVCLLFFYFICQFVAAQSGGYDLYVRLIHKRWPSSYHFSNQSF